MITVVGMGRRCGDLTADGAETIRNADVVVVKSQLTHVAEAVQTLRNDAVYCDDLYCRAQDFDQLNNLILQRLQSFGKRKVAFCVVGDGRDDTTVQLLTDAKHVDGVGLQTALLTDCGGVRMYTAQEFCAEKYVLPLPTVVKSVDDKFVASQVQLKLLQAFDHDTEVLFSCGKTLKKIPLESLCKQRFNYATTIYISPKPLTDRQVFGYYDAVEVLSVLRGENGCPWDRAQTHLSISKNAIEEAYELANAMQKEDNDNVVEELGDLLMQVLFHIEIAEDDGEFEPSAVYTALCRKLIDRHPHVFGSVQAQTAEESLDVWNSQKLKEHKIKNTAQNVLDVPFGMSALLRCQKVQSRASKGGYDFENISQAVDKVAEETREFLQASPSEREMEGGDLLFAVVNLLRLCEVDSETALLVSTQKFCDRVAECEKLLAQRNCTLKDLSASQFDEIWQEAKHNVR